jgi:hypothetical protein
LPQGYQYTVAGQTVTWPADPISGVSSILHLKRFHPLDDWYGLAPMEAAALSIDQHNAAGAWNQSLLNQGARPSGALVFAPKDGPTTLSDDQVQRLREELGQLYQGDRNAGRPLILEGGLDWREMSLSPKDMDWMAGRNAAARDIALAFGVPGQLVGVPDAQTYANFAEARLAFYEETVLPILTRVIAGFDHWLPPMFDDRLELDFDPDTISALSARRDAQWTKAQNASFLTRNEKREIAGYGPVPGGDEDDGGDDDEGEPAPAADSGPDGDDDASTLLQASWFMRGAGKFSPDQPRVPAGSSGGGQWTSGDGENSGMDVGKAVDALNAKAHDHSTGYCARYVREAIQAGGVDVSRPVPPDGMKSPPARIYGPALEDAGFAPVASGDQPATYPPQEYTPQAGDVAVMQPASHNPDGHMSMYNGKIWVSDFRQRDFWPGNAYRNERPSFVIYRYKN